MTCTDVPFVTTKPMGRQMCCLTYRAGTRPPSSHCHPFGLCRGTGSVLCTPLLFPFFICQNSDSGLRFVVPQLPSYLSYDKLDVDVVPIQLAGCLLWALHVHDLANEKFWVLFSGCATLVADVMQICWLPVSAVLLENRGTAAIRATADIISAGLVKQDQAGPVKWDKVYEAAMHGLPMVSLEDAGEQPETAPGMVYEAPLCVVGCHALSAVHFCLLEF